MKNAHFHGLSILAQKVVQISHVSQFWAKRQAYSLTFWWKMPIFMDFQSWHKKWSKFHMWANFEQKGKPIALLFDEKCPFSWTWHLGTKSGPNYHMSQFWAKRQAYSLTFWWKMPIFMDFQSWHKKWSKFHMWANFEQKGKPIALLFDEKCPFSWTWHLGTKSGPNYHMSQFWAKRQAYSLTFWWKMPIFMDFQSWHKKWSKFHMWANFEQKGKPIALLFDEKCPFSWTWHLGTKSGPNYHMSQFWAKMQAYSLTFWWKMPIFMDFQSWHKKWSKFHMWANFEEEGKPIALLFDEKCPFSWTFNLGTKSGPNFTCEPILSKKVSL